MQTWVQNAGIVIAIVAASLYWFAREQVFYYERFLKIPEPGIASAYPDVLVEGARGLFPVLTLVLIVMAVFSSLPDPFTKIFFWRTFKKRYLGLLGVLLICFILNFYFGSVLSEWLSLRRSGSFFCAASADMHDYSVETLLQEISFLLLVVCLLLIMVSEETAQLWSRLKSPAKLAIPALGAVSMALNVTTLAEVRGFQLAVEQKPEVELYPASVINLEGRRAFLLEQNSSTYTLLITDKEPGKACQKRERSIFVVTQSQLTALKVVGMKSLVEVAQ